MKNFISFQKRKGLFVATADSINANENLVHQFNHEIMKYGYVLSQEVFEKLAAQTTDYINEVYNDVLGGIRKVVGTGGHEVIYKNFPQSVMELSYRQFAVNAILHYWSGGTWRPEDADYIKREFAIEAISYKKISDLTEKEYTSIFTDLLYSGASVSGFDKQVLDYFIDNGGKFDFSKISFKETAAYVGKRLMNVDIQALPTKDATNVLRIWAAYSGGDEGLKENTRFKNPSAKQRRIILNTLELCFNLEESFKIYREKWLRVLFNLNPLTKVNAKAFPTVYEYANKLRNDPKSLKTFNSKVEEGLKNKDVAVLDLLKTRSGVFMRRLDHAVRVFGITAISKWLESNPNTLNLMTVYNHFTNRDTKQDGRGAVLASASQSEVVTYEALEPLESGLVAIIKELVLARLMNNKITDFADKKVYIDRTLYYRPLAVNNRATSMSLDGKVNGTVEVLPEGKTLRMYVLWEGINVDIDLSGTVLMSDDSNPVKVGWNGNHAYSNGAIVYSGDNTGRNDKNAEYIDIQIDNLAANAEWIISDAKIYRGGYNVNNYSEFNEPVRAGWMLREKPTANDHWLPDTIEHSVVLGSTSNTAYLMAFHVPTRSVVYLDLSMGNNIVSNAEDALKLKMFLNTFVTVDDGSEEVKWDKINQGHVLNILSTNLVATEAEADLVFDENTTWESISKYI